MLRRALALSIAAAAGLMAVTTAYASTERVPVERVKHTTAKFRDVTVAEAAGYARFVDLNGIACIDMPGMGAMGVHYVKGDLVGDGAIDALTPEAVVYEPDEHGRLHLVALEYVVVKEAWDAHHPSPPSLFGQTFNFTPAGNRYGLPPFYSLHAWLWKHNPAGRFAMWNPKVTCSPDDDQHHPHGAA